MFVALKVVGDLCLLAFTNLILYIVQQVGIKYCACLETCFLYRQDEETRLHCEQAAGKNDVQVRSDTCHYNGSAPEGDPGFL